MEHPPPVAPQPAAPLQHAPAPAAPLGLNLTQEQLVAMLLQQQSTIDQLTKQRRRVKLPAPPETDGRSPPATDWLYRAESYLAAEGYDSDDPNTIKVAAAYFKGAALKWHLAHQAEVAQGRRPDYANWEQFKTAFIARFTPVDPAETARQKLDRCRQIKSASAYTAEFDSHILQLPRMDEADKLHKYIIGLKPQLQMHVALQRPTTLAEAQNLAIVADESLFRMGYRDQRGARDRGRPNYGNHSNAAPRAPQQQGPVNMELDNTEAADNAECNAAGDKKTEGRNCWYCGRGGHVKRNCRHFLADRKNGTLKRDAIPRGPSEGRRDT